jgi:uridine monophosphate synthetase
VALLADRPLVYPRLEAKQYGTARRIEGTWNPGERVVVLDDVITTGASKLEAIRPLEKSGLVVRDIVVLIDRGQGGREALEAEGYRVHALLTLRRIVEVLARLGRISDADRDRVTAFLEGQKP